MIITARVIGTLFLVFWMLYIVVARRHMRRSGSVMFATVFQFNILPFMVGFGLVLTGRMHFLVLLILWILALFPPLIKFLLYVSPLIYGWTTGVWFSARYAPGSVAWYYGAGLMGLVSMFVLCSVIVALVTAPPPAEMEENPVNHEFDDAELKR